MRPAFQCPASMRPHVEKVLRGEYDVPGAPVPALVLDIGANVGAFALWAKRRWPSAYIICYEPEPENCRLLRANIEGNARLEECAVICDGSLRLYEGRSNCGEHSLFPGEEQGKEFERSVVGVGPHRLARCDFLKLDVEGAELAILLGYPHLAGVQAIALEWHSEDLRTLIRHYLTSKGFALVEDKPWRPDRGIMKWRRV